MFNFVNVFPVFLVGLRLLHSRLLYVNLFLTQDSSTVIWAGVMTSTWRTVISGFVSMSEPRMTTLFWILSIFTSSEAMTYTTVISTPNKTTAEERAFFILLFFLLTPNDSHEINHISTRAQKIKSSQKSLKQQVQLILTTHIFPSTGQPVTYLLIYCFASFISYGQFRT